MIGMRLAATAALLALAACSGQAAKDDAPSADQVPAERAAKSASDSDDAPYYTKLPLNEFMPHVMQYAGDGIWKRQGWITDDKGQRSLFPKNDEEWLEAESAALALAEMTNVLLIPGRRVPEPAWDKAAEGVRAVALEAAAAAEKKDENAWFEAGGKLDAACEQCHIAYDPKSGGQPTSG